MDWFIFTKIDWEGEGGLQEIVIVGIMVAHDHCYRKLLLNWEKANNSI